MNNHNFEAQTTIILILLSFKESFDRFSLSFELEIYHTLADSSFLNKILYFWCYANDLRRLFVKAIKSFTRPRFTFSSCYLLLILCTYQSLSKTEPCIFATANQTRISKTCFKTLLLIKAELFRINEQTRQIQFLISIRLCEYYFNLRRANFSYLPIGSTVFAI